MEALRTLDNRPLPWLQRSPCRLWWGEEDLNLRRLRRQIYSLLPLATRASPHARYPSRRRTRMIPKGMGHFNLAAATLCPSSTALAVMPLGGTNLAPTRGAEAGSLKES